MIVDTDKLKSDDAYREDMRHRFLTDHFFAARLLGFEDFTERAHRPAVNLYGPKNPMLPMTQQRKKHNVIHLDPRNTFKTTLKRIDRVQWIAAFSEDITILNQSATQKLASKVSMKTAEVFWLEPKRAPGVVHLLFPEIVTQKRPTFPPPDFAWQTENRRMTGAGDLDPTMSYTSPESTQSGAHPLILDDDDLEDTKNSGISANAEVRENIINVAAQNENVIRGGGYHYIGGTRYHPLDYYGKCLQAAARNPENWDVLVRCSVKRLDGQRILPGEFPRAEELELQFPDVPKMGYAELRDQYYDNYESFMCFTEGSRVLMADWTEKPIEEVRVGDEVIGFEKHGPRNTKFVKSSVKTLFVRTAQAVESATACGRKIQHTPDHKFLRVPNGGKLQYGPVKVGSRLVSVYEPYERNPLENEQRCLDWLGGMLDGEGSISETGAAIYQKKETNPEICDAIERVLTRLGITWKTGWTHSTTRYSLAGGRTLLIRLLQSAKMYKTARFHKTLFASKQISESSGRRGGGTYPVIAKVKPLGEQVVYDIETTTHNFVCEGFAVHNCQQQNDPMGGSLPKFDERMYESCLIAPDRIPLDHMGDTLLCFRPQYGGKKDMMRYTEGVAARIIDGRIYVLDCWQGTYAPSGMAAHIVTQQRRWDAKAVILVRTPGSEHIEAHVRNEAARRNISCRVQWTEFEDDDHVRAAKMETLEPLLRVGRVTFSTAMTKGAECRSQFVNFGLTLENGIIECIAKLTDRIPISQLRASMQEEELEYQRRRREDAQMNHYLSAAGMPVVDELARQKAEAHFAAMSKLSHRGLPALPGGLDG